ncbi:uncharacterized protein LOC113518057 [Galleria mellonella]|uniref:Uncharacterized protein LOC113518057 n=1 Tax=Galleria mellonella TaxID=7137 RepID=A0A6J1WSC5_GALME|nr:uncharacterized protein LOC113518057 [Galleria mellonella]
MRIFSQAVLLITAVVVTAAWTIEHKPKIKRQEAFKPFNTNSGLTGVASIAGVTSRNGRVSSLSGIKLFPSVNQEIVGNGDARQFFYPLTVSKESDGKFASNSIQVYPGSVIVSAKSGYGPNVKSWPAKLDLPFDGDIFLQPDLDVFSTARNLDTWFPKNIFRPIVPPTIDNFRNNWLYPTYNPFVNIWR